MPPRPTSPPGRRARRPAVPSTRREQRRAELLDAALRVIRRGEGRVAMEDIAAEAGISRPILYRHFGDATGLYGAVADDFCRELLYRLSRSLRGIPRATTCCAARSSPTSSSWPRTRRSTGT